jgi:hypothetical protein
VSDHSQVVEVTQCVRVCVDGEITSVSALKSICRRLNGIFFPMCLLLCMSAVLSSVSTCSQGEVSVSVHIMNTRLVAISTCGHHKILVDSALRREARGKENTCGHQCT